MAGALRLIAVVPLCPRAAPGIAGGLCPRSYCSLEFSLDGLSLAPRNCVSCPSVGSSRDGWVSELFSYCCSVPVLCYWDGWPLVPRSHNMTVVSCWTLDGWRSAPGDHCELSVFGLVWSVDGLCYALDSHRVYMSLECFIDDWRSAPCNRSESLAFGLPCGLPCGLSLGLLPGWLVPCTL